MVTLFIFLIFIYSIILHEIAHGLAAERLGDPTARVSGRLNLNPLSHIDPIMSVLVPLFLILSGSPIVFGSAKPVPIDPYNLKNPKKDMGFIALAGPATNLVIAVLLSFVARLLLAVFPQTIFLEILKYGVQINIVLAIFNLIPIPPLDGGRVAVAILPYQYSEALASIESIGIFIVLFFLFFPTPLFSFSGLILRFSSFLFRFIFPGFPLI